MELPFKSTKIGHGGGGGRAGDESGALWTEQEGFTGAQGGSPFHSRAIGEGAVNWDWHLFGSHQGCVMPERASASPAVEWEAAGGFD